MNSQTEKEKVAAKFDYETLDSQQSIDIKQTTEAIRQRLRKAAQDVWEIGRMLHNVQSKLKRGQFDEWVKTEFDWSRRTAYKFISVYKKFDRSINLEEINIGASALYLLAAESTPEDIREEFIQKAQEGENITHQEVLQVVREAKAKSNPAREAKATPIPAPEATTTPIPTSERSFSSEKPAPKQELVSIIPQAKIEKPLSSSTVATGSTTNTDLLNIKPGWYRLDKHHSVFFGDTALSEFADRIPYAAIAIAITADDWAHDWLIEKARTVVVFSESEFDTQKLVGLITMFSDSGDKIIFPWLPHEEMIAIAHQLGRQVFGGDMNPQRCQEAIIKTGLSIEAIDV